MKFKSISKVLASVLVVSLVFSSASLVNAKGPENHKTEQKVKTQKEVKSQKVVKENKGKAKKSAPKAKATPTIQQRLNSSDAAIAKVTKEANAFFSVVATSTESTGTTPTSSTPATPSTDTATATIPVTPTVTAVSTDTTTTTVITEEQANRKYHSYKGKLKAEFNKLRAIDKQLEQSLKKGKITTEQHKTLLDKSKALQKVATEEIARIKELAAKYESEDEDEDDKDEEKEDATKVEVTTKAVE